MAGALSTETAAGPEQPGIQQAPHRHEGPLLHPGPNAPAPEHTKRTYVRVIMGFKRTQ